MPEPRPSDDAAGQQTAVSSPEAETHLAHRTWLLALVLVVVTVVAYLPLLSGTFIWDDDAWTAAISHLLRDVSGLRSMWCHLTALQQYYPLTGTLFWLDYHLWGFWTLPYHVENVLLHALAALLFWRLLWRLQVPGAWLASAIFALHPVMVDSAGWITERKNVLSLVLYLGALLVYGRWTSFWKADNDSAPCADNSPPHWRDYLLAWLLALGALLAKTTAFSLPAVILLIGWWKRGRIRWRTDVLPTVPFFALSIGLGLVTASVEKNHVGASGPEWAISFAERCLIAGRALVFYISKLLWPANLCFVYPRWQLDAHAWWQWLYPAIAVATVLGLWFARRRMGRGPTAAAFFFVGTLFPLLGFMNAYFMRYSFVCDHWVYLSSLGPIALAAAGMTAAFRLFQPRRVILESVFYGTLLLILGACTWKHAHVYRDIETLWRDTIAKNPQGWLGHNNLGVILEASGRLGEAEQQYRHAVQIRPNYSESHFNLGSVLLMNGEVGDAGGEFEQALRIRPGYYKAHNNLGYVFLKQGKLSDAEGEFEQALRIKPDYAEAHNNLGYVLLTQGKVSDAEGEFEQALRIKPDYAEARNNLGDALVRLGKPQEAVAQYEQALQVDPKNADAHSKLGAALIATGKAHDALGHLELALRANPDLTEAQNNLAWLLATHAPAGGGDAARAVSLAQRACELTDNHRAGYLDTLAAAYAAAGRFPEAIATTQKAIDLARAAGQSKSVGEYDARLELYRNGRAYRPPADTAIPNNR